MSNRGVTLLLLCIKILYVGVELAKHKTDLVNVSDPKDFKKFVRTHTNVLAIFAKSGSSVPQPERDVFVAVAEQMKGVASVILVDCSSEKKPCKKLKSFPGTYEVKHFRDGEFNRIYDRRFTVRSMCNFLRNPTGDIPWDEDASGVDVVHLESRENLMKLISKEKRPLLIMFYAPWCGHCKQLKPEFAAAATELKSTAVLAGMDVDRSENTVVRAEFNITGFPTLCYFENSVFQFRYGGENNKNGIVEWMKNPTPPKEPVKEAEWFGTDSDIVSLSSHNFEEYISSASSVLVMFFAPWCGHCKKAKPEFEQAAEILKEEEIDGMLAAVDATKEAALAKQYGVQGFPTVKYFKDGKFAWDFNERSADKIVEFMRNPEEPPPAQESEDLPWEQVSSNIVHLTSEMFRSFTKKKKHVLVMFYAPWCGHCKKAKPEFESAAEHFLDDNKVQFAAVDCTKHNSVCNSQEVSGYPTFKYFNYGKNDIKYTGGRQQADFIRFMKDPMSPLSLSAPKMNPEDNWHEVDAQRNLVHLTDVTFDLVMPQHKSALVLFYAPWCGHCKAMKPAYAEAAATLKNLAVEGVLAAVDVTVEKMLHSRFQITGFPTIKHFIYGVEQSVYSEGRTVDDFVNFMKAHAPSGEGDPFPPAADSTEVPASLSQASDISRTVDEL